MKILKRGATINQGFTLSSQKKLEDDLRGEHLVIVQDKLPNSISNKHNLSINNNANLNGHKKLEKIKHGQNS